MKSKQNESAEVWIIIIIVLVLIAGLFFVDARIMGAYKARAKALQDCINVNDRCSRGSIDEDTIFREDPMGTNRGEIKREYLEDGVN